jgi:hypothetical protein
MKRRCFIAATGLLISAASLQLSAAPNQMVPKGLGDTITIPGLISYRAPNGWSQEETNASPQPRGPISNGVVPDITFNPTNHGSLDDFVTNFQPELFDSGQSLKYLDKTSFVTAAGVKGIRCRCVDPTNTITQYSYVFLSSDGQQLELACACASVDVKVYLPVFDASMKTVVIAKGD